MTKNIKKILISLLIFSAFFFGGMWFGYHKIINQNKNTVSGMVIVQALQDRGFLITQSSIANQTIEISKNQEGFWNKLFWQQIIKAEAITEVNLGVDLKKMSEQDITVSNNKIIVKITPVEIFDDRILGDINLQNKQGVLKKLFENEDGYNEAQTEILSRAAAAASSEENLLSANQKAAEEVKRIIGYMVKDKNTEIIVEVKN